MKKYIQPIMMVEDIQSLNMFALSNPTVAHDPDDTINGRDALGNSRRGTWGDLWSDED